jgi:hypothetical protein
MDARSNLEVVCRVAKVLQIISFATIARDLRVIIRRSALLPAVGHLMRTKHIRYV